MPVRKSTNAPEEDAVTDIHTEIAKRLCKIISEAPPLVKDERNTFANYSYVSIDTYYEKFASLAASHGLTWVARELSFDTIEAADEKSGRVKTLAKATYAFDVYVVGVGVVEAFTRFTIVHPLTGAQTTGSAVSYAEKVFMRTTMKAVTGEPDADAVAPQQLKDAKPVQAAPYRGIPPTAELIERAKPHVESLEEIEGQRLPVIKEAADNTVAIEIFRVFAPLCNTESQLLSFWSQNKAALSAIGKSSPDDYARIRAIFNDRKNAIARKE